MGRPRTYRRVGLTVPALCRDALDRVGPLGNAVFLVAFLLFHAWVAVFLALTIADLVAQRGLGLLLTETWIQPAFTTAVLGALLWASGPLARIVCGGLIAWIFGRALVAGIPSDVALIQGYVSGARTWPFSAAVTPVLLCASWVSLAIMAQLTIAAAGLVLFGRKDYWRAFSVGGDENLTPIRQLLARLGVADTGFYRGWTPRLVMLLVKAAQAIGTLAALVALFFLSLTLATPQMPDPAPEEVYRFFLLTTVISGAVAGVALAIAFLVGARFRRKFPSPRIGAREDLDGRPLFLRSFRDDSVKLCNPRPFSPLPLPVDVPRNLDEIILARLPQTAAFGNRDDRQPRFGVERHDLGDGPWQEAVALAIERSSLVIVSVDDTEGLDWELAEILARGDARKTKFLMHPRLPGASKAKVAAALGATIDPGDLRRLRGLDCARSGEIRAYLGAPSAAAYRCMLGWMIER